MTQLTYYTSRPLVAADAMAIRVGRLHSRSR